MQSLLKFIETDTFFAFLFALFFFCITLFLFVKNRIGFSLTTLFLLFIVLASLGISHYNVFKSYVKDFTSNYSVEEEPQSAFKKQITQALEDVKIEVSTEKENLQLLMNRVEELFDQMNVQKVKLQQFIEETKEQFRTEDSPEKA